MQVKANYILHNALLVLLVLFTSCQRIQPLMLEQPASQVEQISLLIMLDGPASLKREGWKIYQPVYFGAVIHPSDLLNPEGQVSLLCPDMKTVLLQSDLGRNPCQPVLSEQAFVYDEMEFISRSRSTPASTVPYILYPRSTAILESLPILRWHHSEGDSFTAEIWQGASLVWQQTGIQGNTFLYPESAPKLQANKDYLLVIIDETSGLASSADPNKGLGFQLLSSDLQNQVIEQEQIINSLSNLDDAGQKLALALYMAQVQENGRGLWGEAYALLSDVAQIQPHAPAVHLRTGEVLNRMQLWDESEAAFKTALRQAEDANDLASQAEALTALWRISGNPDNLAHAITLYEQIGDEAQAVKLKEELSP